MVLVCRADRYSGTNCLLLVVGHWARVAFKAESPFEEHALGHGRLCWRARGRLEDVLRWCWWWSQGCVRAACACRAWQSGLVQLCVRARSSDGQQAKKRKVLPRRHHARSDAPVPVAAGGAEGVRKPGKALEAVKRIEVIRPKKSEFMINLAVSKMGFGELRDHWSYTDEILAVVLNTNQLWGLPNSFG